MQSLEKWKDETGPLRPEANIASAFDTSLTSTIETLRPRHAQDELQDGQARNFSLYHVRCTRIVSLYPSDLCASLPDYINLCHSSTSPTTSIFSFTCRSTTDVPNRKAASF